MPDNKRIIFFLILCVISRLSFAQISTDRPSVSFGTSIVTPGSFQLETGFQVDGAGNETFTTYNTSLFRYGVNEFFEFRMSANVVEGSKTSLTPVSFGFKSKLTEEKGILPELSFLGQVALPSGNNEFKTESAVPSFRVIANHSLSDSWSLGYNWGMDWTEGTSDATNAYTVILGTSFSDKLSWFVEVYGFIMKDTEDDLGIDSGLAYLLNDRWQIDAYGGFGLTDGLSDWFTGAGISFVVGGRE